MTIKKTSSIGAVLAIICIAILLAGAKPKADQQASEKIEVEENDSRLELPVATIDDKTITLGYLEKSGERQSPVLRSELREQSKRKEFLDKLINMSLLSAEAERRGYSDNDEVAAVRKNQLASLMHRRIAESIGKEEPTEESLQQYYDSHEKDYHKPEKVRARHILIEDQATAEKLLKEMLGKKTSQHEFRRLAQEKTEDTSTKMRGGDLAFFTRPADRKEGDPDIPAAVIEAAFKIEKNGAIHPKLAKSKIGYHLVMRTGHRDRMDLSFEDARDRIAILVRRETRKNSVQEAIDNLKNNFSVEIKEENLKYVVIDLSPGGSEHDGPGSAKRKKSPKRTRKFVEPAISQKGLKKPAPKKELMQ
jgi:peptidyl-prolyl cis-trans isomerase C